MRSATRNITMRNTASPVFPVGESTRRHVVCAISFSVTALISNQPQNQPPKKHKGTDSFENTFVLYVPFWWLYLSAAPPAVIELIFTSARFTMSSGSDAYCNSFA